MAAIGKAQGYLVAYLLLTTLMTGCGGCTEEQLLQNLNNGNSDPEVLIIEAWGTDIRQALELATGQDCLGFSDFTARVEVRVFTASYVDGQVMADPTPYYEDILLDVPFFANTGFNDGTQIQVSVPETGAYALEVVVEVDACSMCCHGAGTNQCGTRIDGGKCEAGHPRVRNFEVFPADDRPKPNYNHPLNFLMAECVCGCNVEC